MEAISEGETLGAVGAISPGEVVVVEIITKGETVGVIIEGEVVGIITQVEPVGVINEGE